MTDIRQELIRTDAKKRKTEYCVKDKEIANIIFEFKSLETDKIIYRFLTKISCQLQRFQKLLITEIESDDTEIGDN